MQIIINDVCYLVNGVVTENEVISFITELEQKLLASNNSTSVVLLDNASNHRRSFRVRTRLESICNGRYYYCAAYSPWLKPIEKGVSLVKTISHSIELEGEWKNNPALIICSGGDSSRDNEGNNSACDRGMWKQLIEQYDIEHPGVGGDQNYLEIVNKVQHHTDTLTGTSGWG
jgi:hypothetical protein